MFIESAIKILVFGFGKQFHPILTIDEYTGFFLAIILGLGISFELPILIFFLALFGIVDAKFLLRHFRYAILAIFLVAAIICPMPDPAQHVPLCQPNARAVFPWRGHCILGPSRSPQAKQAAA